MVESHAQPTEIILWGFNVYNYILKIYPFSPSAVGDHTFLLNMFAKSVLVFTDKAVCYY